MVGSDQICSPLMPTTVPKVSASVDNDENYQQKGPNLKNQKKSATKNFMSPTISAASKAVVPRKKILAERNENFSDTHVQKSPIFYSRENFTRLGIDNSDKSFPQEDNAFVTNSSSRPYDPLTNYLSPRPKFLRYKPNRRREIFLRPENEIKEEKEGLGVDQDRENSVSFESQNSIDYEEAALVSDEGFDYQEDEEMDESDEEIEELEEERCCSLKGVLKFLLLIFVLGGCTLYISAMNSITPLVPSQDFEVLKYGNCSLQNHISGGLKNLGGYHFVDEKEGTLEVGVTDYGIEEEDVKTVEVKNIDDLSEVVENVEDEKMGMVDGLGEVTEFGEIEDVKIGEVKNIDDLSEMVVENVEDEKMGMVDELGEIIEFGETEDVCDHEMVENSDLSEMVVENVEDEKMGMVDGLGEVTEFGEIEDVKIGEVKNIDDLSEMVVENVEDEKMGMVDELGEIIEFGETEDVCDHEMVENSDLQGMGSVKGLEPLQDYQIPLVFNVVDHHETVPDLPNVFEEESEVLNENENANANYETLGVIKHAETESNIKAMMGISLSSLIAVASLVLGFHFKRKRTIREDSSSIIKHSSESVIVEKCSSVLPNVGGQELHIEHIDSFAKPLPSIRFEEEEASRECYQSRAPTIELLGEFVVGEVSSSIKRSRKEEGGESIDSISIEKKRLTSKARSVPIHPQPAFSESSAINYPSYGNFTPEKKFVNKEESRDGEEVSKIVTTPVRRSSRLRSRAAASP